MTATILQFPTRPRACTRCGRPGGARCPECITRLARRADKLHPRPVAPLDVDLCAGCSCIVFGHQRVAFEVGGSRIWCSPSCWAQHELGDERDVRGGL